MSAGRQEPIGPAQHGLIVFDVLQHVAAEDRIQLLVLPASAMVFARQVAAVNADVVPVVEPPAEEVNIGPLLFDEHQAHAE